MSLGVPDVSRFTRLRTLILKGVSSETAAKVQPNTNLPPSLQCLGLTSLHTLLFEVRPMQCQPAWSVTCVTPRSLSYAHDGMLWQSRQLLEAAYTGQSPAKLKYLCFAQFLASIG